MDAAEQQARLQLWLESRAPGYLWLLTPLWCEELLEFRIVGWFRNPYNDQNEHVVTRAIGAHSEALRLWIETIPDPYTIWQQYRQQQSNY